MATWTPLGRIKPIHDQWIRLPQLSSTTGEIFRCQFFGDIEHTSSYIWFRGIYSLNNGEELALRSTRIYPQEFKLILEYPHPAQIRQHLGDFTNGRWIEAKKINRFYRGSGYLPDSLWEVAIAELTP